MPRTKGNETAAYVRDQNDLRAAWVWLQEVERATGGVVTLTMQWGLRKGILQYAYVLEKFDGENYPYKVCSYSAEYPNVHPRTLCGELFNGIVKLDQLAADCLGYERLKISER